MFKKLLYTAIGLSLVLSCREDEEVINTPPVVVDSTLTVDLSGYVQKGPFINGTAITVSELDKKLVTTGKNFTTQIADNKGSFSLKGIKLKSNFVQLQADGFYFDEVKGEKSAAQLTLFALSDVEDVSSINANLLSHMERTRVIYLMQEEEKTFAEAKQQAQQEILAIFGIAREEMQKSELLDISQNGEDNAILLAISAVLQANNSVAELSELVANLITDLREDGVLSSQSNKDKIREQGKVLNLPQIRLNLEKRYEELGVNATIPNFEQYIDSDGDGILNKDEDDNPDDFTFTLQKDVAVSTAITSNTVKISGLKEGGTANAAVKGGKIILNGQVASDSVVQVKNGDALQLQLASSQTYADTVKATLSIGTVVKHFQVITDDYVPDAFSFMAQKDVAVDSVYTSNMITVSGIPHPTPLTIEGGKVIKNGEELITDTTSVKNGDKLAVKLLSSSGFASATSSTVDINGVTASFTITTDDYVPDDFSFSSVESAYKSSSYFSNTIVVSGLKYPTIAKVEEGTIILNENEISDQAVQVNNGDHIALKSLSSSMWNSSSTSNLTIGSLTKEFIIFNRPNLWKKQSSWKGWDYDYEFDTEIDGKFYCGPRINHFYEYNPTTNIWTRKADFLGVSRHSNVAFTHNGLAYVGLGNAESDNFSLKDMWQYDPGKDQWKKLSDFPGAPRAGATCIVIDGKAYIGLGSNTEAIDTYQELNDFWEYDIENDQWKQLSNFPGGKRIATNHFVINDVGYVIGGATFGNEKKDVWKYFPETDSWERMGDMPHVWSFNQSFVLNDKGYLVINHFDENEQKLWEYDPFKDTWLNLEYTAFPVSSYHTYRTFEGKAYINHGKVVNNELIHEVWIYTP